jgi:23S rRNA (cytosine1962-C5)-methyltransferase
VIVLDPPAFVKDRHKVKEGLMGYTKINEMALAHFAIRAAFWYPRLVRRTLPCLIFDICYPQSAGHTRRSLQVLETYTHGIDHPELVSFMEGEYLKCVFARVA